MGERRIKISELSQRAQISRKGLYPIFNERSKGIEYETLAKLCKALDCSVGDLLEYVPDDE